MIRFRKRLTDIAKKFRGSKKEQVSEQQRGIQMKEHEQTGMEIAQDVLAVFAAIVEEEHMYDIDAFTVDWDNQDTREFFENDIKLFRNIMELFFNIYGFEYDIEPGTEFDKFPILNDAWNHVLEMVLEVRGFDVYTLEPK